MFHFSFNAVSHGHFIICRLMWKVIHSCVKKMRNKYYMFYHALTRVRKYFIGIVVILCRLPNEYWGWFKVAFCRHPDGINLGVTEGIVPSLHRLWVIIQISTAGIHLKIVTGNSKDQWRKDWSMTCWRIYSPLETNKGGQFIMIYKYQTMFSFEIIIIQ